MRTSITDPIRIAEVQPYQNFGKIGLTFCPGKIQPHPVSGPWARDLDVDLDAIADWNAAAVLTLIDNPEMKAIKVTEIGRKVAERHMAWFHLPITDVSTPDAEFERQWKQVGEDLRTRLRSGANVLVHCRGGLGRAGTIAARLLVELGWSPDTAMAAVRKVRRGAIETRAQEAHVRAAERVPEVQPCQTLISRRDRAVGAMLGLAVGDAIGTTLEFCSRDQAHVSDMVGGGPFGLQAGQWTDDTSLALALMDSLSDNPTLDEADLMRRFVRWFEDGEYSATGRCFDIGLTTRQALMRWKQTGNGVAGSTDPKAAGNGSLMRLAPVAVRHWQDRDLLRDVAARQSMTTHGAPEAVDACIGYAEILADAIWGQPRTRILQNREGTYAGAIGSILAGSWRAKRRKDIRASGYVAHSLEAALWCISRTASFEEAVLLAANLGEDADTTAAITGQLAGALYGASQIPSRWLDKLAWRERITNAAGSLFDDGIRAEEADEDLMQGECEIATSRSWPNLRALPARHVTIPLDIRLDAKRAVRIRQGFIPSVMEEKWFAYFEDGILYQHRSWTGICIDQVHFEQDGDGLRATSANVNRDPEEYGETDDMADAERIRAMVLGLADMPDGAHSKAVDPMVAALQQATQPNYLGSPDVIRALLAPIVEGVVGMWRGWTTSSIVRVTPDDVQASSRQLVAALSGNDPTYIVMPWHSVEQLGQNLIFAMGLDADYCRGESLEFILTEAVAAFRIRLSNLVRQFLYTSGEDWDRDVEPKLVRLVQFFESALLGTNGVIFPGLTLDVLR